MHTSITSFLRASLLLCSCLLLGACAVVLRNPVPADSYTQVSVLGRQDLRIWGDEQENPKSVLILPSDPDTLQREFSGIMHTEHSYLAISGGGADGAYGAGVLVGWSALGTRPEFTMVTGVSTGALTAPFAFLGEAYDEQLKMLYTTLDSASIFYLRGVFAILRGDAVADNTPLMRMLEQYVTDEMIAEIAREHRRGRILTIGTTDLDAGRPVIWNIGRIANSGHPDAPHLIRQVLLASAAIPGVFPPAYIQVQTPDGKTYDEMHVDGGTSTQMFLYPTRTDFVKLREMLDIRGTPRAYVIRNSRIHPDYEPIRAWLPDIAGRSVSSLIRTQGIGDAYRIAATTQRDGVALKMTWIPSDAPADPGEALFDPNYMSALFKFGYQRVIDGDAWSSVKILKLREQGAQD
jgi:predicted patatin/cPLA2 family phospholipase